MYNDLAAQKRCKSIYKKLDFWMDKMQMKWNKKKYVFAMLSNDLWQANEWDVICVNQWKIFTLIRQIHTHTHTYPIHTFRIRLSTEKFKSCKKYRGFDFEKKKKLRVPECDLLFQQFLYMWNINIFNNSSGYHMQIYQMQKKSNDMEENRGEKKKNEYLPNWFFFFLHFHPLYIWKSNLL